jgi:hypothetical protein
MEPSRRCFILMIHLLPTIIVPWVEEPKSMYGYEREQKTHQTSQYAKQARKGHQDVTPGQRRDHAAWIVPNGTISVLLLTTSIIVVGGDHAMARNRHGCGNRRSHRWSRRTPSRRRLGLLQKCWCKGKLPLSVFLVINVNLYGLMFSLSFIWRNCS